VGGGDSRIPGVGRGFWRISELSRNSTGPISLVRGHPLWRRVRRRVPWPRFERDPCLKWVLAWPCVSAAEGRRPTHAHARAPLCAPRPSKRGHGTPRRYSGHQQTRSHHRRWAHHLPRRVAPGHRPDHGCRRDALHPCNWRSSRSEIQSTKTRQEESEPSCPRGGLLPGAMTVRPFESEDRAGDQPWANSDGGAIGRPRTSGSPSYEIPPTQPAALARPS
jgi:hypothetical protein